MLIHVHNKEEFEQHTSTGKVLVDFFATWCGPCQRLGPVLEEVAEEHPEIDIIKVDVDEVGDVAQEYGIASIPTLIVFENGEVKANSLGYMAKQAVEDFIGL